MRRIVHISDVHLLRNKDADEAGILSSLVAALQAVVSGQGQRGVDLLVVTGDLFNSARIPPEIALPRFRRWWEAVDRVLGAPRTILVPGNHDVRETGLIGPHSTRLVDALVETLTPARGRVLVHGWDVPYLIARVPPGSHGLPVEMLAVDSTYLPQGKVSAGGVLRQEDLLCAASRFDPGSGGLPLVVLLHHHLVPTPVMDVQKLDVRGQTLWKRLFVREALPRLVANADCEELTMTALGAGTTLTTLHTLGRAVMVLHGHKHYPAVRLVRSPFRGHGDVLLASAGSAGLVETWTPAEHAGGATLWPSFNLIEWDRDEVRIDAVLYPETVRGQAAADAIRRPLAQVRRLGSQWAVVFRPAASPPRGAGPHLGRNLAVFTLSAGVDGRRHWDAQVERTVACAGGCPATDSYRDEVAGPPGARIVGVLLGGRAGGDAHCPAALDLPFNAQSSYRLLGGYAATVGQALADYGPDAAPYEWVGLLNRYQSEVAELTVRALPAGAGPVFGSLTDLTTGLQQPMPLAPQGDGQVLAMQDCPPRTLLRIYWKLPR